MECSTARTVVRRYFHSKPREVRDASRQQAINLVKAFYSACEVRVIFPIDPEGFFVEDALGAEGLIERGKLQEEEKLAA